MPKAILMILDGYGYTKTIKGNAIAAANTPFLDSAMKEYHWNLLKCSGLAVGLPEGQMGNSEVGHLNIGAGRVVYQELTRITKSIVDGDFYENTELNAAMDNVNFHSSALHIMGLCSHGGVHSELDHCKAIVKLAKKKGVKKVFLHCFMDGRDTLPTSGVEYISELSDFLEEQKLGKIATVTGRYYAMDRDKRYERVVLAYNAMCLGEGEKCTDAVEAVKNAYLEGVTDEFIKPHVVVENGVPIGVINDNDSVVFFNFRADRAREITDAITQKAFIGFERKKTVDTFYVCMTPYDASFTGLHIAYAPEALEDTLGEYLSKNGKKQLRIAETEKYAHVTYFFNGGVEKQYEKEDRKLVPSPKVATYDLKPEMSAGELTEELTTAINSGVYDFILVNYANCDMVGHTGVFDAAVKAVEAVDACAALVSDCAKRNGYTVMITADHGNAELMEKDGEIITSHSTNDVVFIVMDKAVNAIEPGSLRDIAPSVLDVMGLKKPEKMTGKSLLAR